MDLLSCPIIMLILEQVRDRFGWTTLIVLVPNLLSLNAATADGVKTTAVMMRMLE